MNQNETEDGAMDSCLSAGLNVCCEVNVENESERAGARRHSARARERSQGNLRSSTRA